MCINLLGGDLGSGRESSSSLLLMIPPPLSRINNQDSTTEMLLGALGAKIVNSRDAKGR